MRTYPKTASHDITDVLHGEIIADPYRWLENHDDPEAQAWTAKGDESGPCRLG